MNGRASSSAWWLGLPLLLLLLLIAPVGEAAPPDDAGSVASYTFLASAGAFTPLSGATPVVVIEGKDAGSDAIPLGFTFWFMGVPYTEVWANSNGHLSFNPEAPFTSTFSMRTNSLASGNSTLRPMLAPLWDDLSGGVTGTASYLTTGSPGSQVFTFEWLDWKWNHQAGGAVISFQARLYEATGAIEFSYEQEAGAVNLGSASIGLTAIDTGSGNYVSVSSVDTTPTASSTSEDSGLDVKPPSGQLYTFTPPAVVPAAPTGLNFTGVTETAMTLNWTDNATGEAGYTILRSTDGVNFSFAATTAADAVSYTASGLAPGGYHWQVYAVTEGQASTALSGNQATLPAGEISCAGAGGNWSNTATWSGGVLPATLDNVTINDGCTVTVDADATINNLTVGQGTSGLLQFEAATARFLTVNGNLAIAAGGTLQSAATGTVTSHRLIVGADLTNDGTLDLSTNSDTAGAELRFKGATHNTFGGSGTTTDLRLVTLTKGDIGNIIEMTLPFTVRGAVSNDTSGFLATGPLFGTFKLSGSATYASNLIPTATYTLFSDSRVWLNNPNFTVNGQNGTATLTGRLRVTAGTFNVGTSTDDSLVCNSLSRVIIEGGAVNVAGRFGVKSPGFTFTYVQSGGTMTVGTAGATSTTLGSFDVGTSFGTNFTVIDGTIVVRNASSAGSGPRDYRASIGTHIFDNATLQFGDAASGGAQTFTMGGSGSAFPDLVISNASAAHSLQVASGPVTGVSATINPTTTLTLAPFDFILQGDLVNDGTLTGTTAGSALDFDGTTAQTWSGSGSVTAPLDGLTLDNPAGLTLSGNPFTVLRVNLLRGTLTSSSKITLGNGGTTSATTQIGASGLTAAGGNYDAAPTFNAGSGGVHLLYEPEGVPRTTGVEVPSGRTVASLSVNNSNGVTLSGGGLAIDSGLTLVDGLFHTTAANLPTLGTGLASPPAGSATSYVNGPLSLQLNSATDVSSRNFGVGSGAAWRPVVLGDFHSGGTLQAYTAEIIGGDTDGTLSCAVDCTYETAGCMGCPDFDNDGYTASSCGGTDCDDGDAAINPGATEVCDNVDNNCAGGVDESLTQSCGSDVGVCVSGTETCTAGAWGACVGETVPSAEVCDNADNDCDGTVDEDLVQSCGSDVGACQSGFETCSAGAWGSCVGEIGPAAEVCDNLDNNCDGTVDESLVQSCGSDVGACVSGTETCTAGAWGSCVGEVAPSAEICDNVDNNCDGTVDDLVQSCGSDVGACQSGFETCTAGAWGSCVGEIVPTAEVCDNVDNNCDGTVDESLTQSCGSDVGVCVSGTETCTAGAWGSCVGETGPSAEVCDTNDNDCDGAVDEDGVCSTCGNGTAEAGEDCDGTDLGGGSCLGLGYSGGTLACDGGCSYDTSACTGCPDFDNDGYTASSCGGTDCDDGDAAINPGATEVCDNVDNNCAGGVDESLTQSCGSDVGACVSGTETCTAGAWGACVGETVPSAEVCDNADNDCDGTVDEDLVQSCGSDVGACQSGFETCSAGAWGSCDGEIGPSTEVCDNLDNNCDGTVDESLVQSCGSDVGACVSGTETCSAGAWGSCVGEVAPSAEICDNVDNNCDGTVDDVVQSCGSDVGACQSGFETCTAGAWGSCIGEVGSSTEVCDNLDNNCDGTVDESLTQPCGSDVGACVSGTETCTAGAWGSCVGEVAPSAEVCDAADNDCDGAVDEDGACSNCGNGTAEAGEDCDGADLAGASCFSLDYGGSPDPPLTSLNPARYFRVQNTANIFSDSLATVQLSYGVDDTIPDVANARVAQSSDAAGNYTSRGGGASVTPTTGILSETAINQGDEYFILADGTPPVPPANDDCSASVVIPATGPFPYLTSTVDVASATTTGDPTFCATTSHTAWYTFTPTLTAPYTFSTCPSAAPGTTATDTVLGIFTGATCAGPFTTTACNDDDGSCAGLTGRSFISADLVSGTTYYVVVGTAGVTTPSPAKVQIAVDQLLPPANDSCASPVALSLNTPVTGSTFGGLNDYKLNGPSCFTGQGQIGNTTSGADGLDVVYSFTAPAAGSYSFRITDYTAGDAVLYTATSCPASSFPSVTGVNTCVSAANRTSSQAEEVMCQTLSNGETVYAVVDEDVAAGGTFTIEVTACDQENESNNSIGQADTLSCGKEGSIPTADDDYYLLGSPGAGWRVFTLIDSIASEFGDTEMRVTDSADVYEFDDDDGDDPFGRFGTDSVISGAVLPAGSTYIKVQGFNDLTDVEPYRLYSVAQPPIADASAEAEPNDTTVTASTAANNYFAGSVSTGTDTDFYSFSASAGDLVFLGMDCDSDRDGMAVDGELALLDPNGTTVLISVDGSGTSQTPTPSPGVGLAASTPAFAGEGLVYRIRTTGTYYARVTGVPGATAAEQDYALSVSTNCEIPPADVAVSQVADVEPVIGGTNVTYTVTVTNNGPSTAYNLVLTDNIPADMTFVSVTPPAGWSCGAPSGSQYTCTAASLANAAPAVFTMVYQANYCTGNVPTTHTVSVSTDTIDPVSADNTSDLVSNITDPGVCSDFNLCTTGDACAGSVCVGTPVVCDDSDVCTSEFCNLSTGLCDSGPPLNCDDSNACTDDFCDSVTGCFWVNDDTNICTDDGDLCSDTEVCVAGVCVGSPVDCSDGNECTDDSCDAGTGACLYANNTNSCNDSSLCTSGDTCGPHFSEDFDGVTPPAIPAGWSTTLVTGVGGDTAFVTVVDFIDTAPNAAFTDTPDHVTDKVLDSPSVAITTATAELTFRHRYDLENTFDGAVLEISIGGGAFTDILAAGGSFTAGAYDAAVSAAQGSPIAGRSAWTGNSAGFITTTVNLPATAAGQSIVLRWRVVSDTVVGLTGYWVDSIDLTDPGGTHTCEGAPVTCDDAEICTVDSCDPGTGCVFTPGMAGTQCRASSGETCDPAEQCDGVSATCPPDFVGPSSAVGNTVGVSYSASIATIDWSGETEAGPFNVYLGNRLSSGSWSYNHTCMASGVAGTSTTDSSALSVGELGYYLVSRTTPPCPESNLGMRSIGPNRPNNTPCP